MKNKTTPTFFKLFSYLVFALGKQLDDEDENTCLRTLIQLF